MSDNRDQFGRRFEGLEDNILDSYIFMPKISLADVLGVWQTVTLDRIRYS